MIVNQALNLSAGGSRPLNIGKAGSTGAAAANDELKAAASECGDTDTVAVNTQRLIVSENLNASEAVIPDRSDAGSLMSMLKKQLEFNPAEAMDAQTGHLAVSATRLLTD